MTNNFEVPTTEVDETTVSTEPKVIRAWLKENDYELDDRGRIATELRNIYLEAHGILDTTEDDEEL